MEHISGQEMHQTYRIAMLLKAAPEDRVLFLEWDKLGEYEQAAWENLAKIYVVDTTDRSNEFPLLTPEEWDVYSALSDAYNQFIALPVFFEGDWKDFSFHINALKSIVMSRPVEREMVQRNWAGYKKLDEDVKEQS